MPRPTPDQILQKIRAALVAEVAEKGIGATSVAAVAKRAGVATGTIYLQFDSKEDMLQKIYLQIKTEFHGLIVAAVDEPSSKEMIRKMWFEMFAFVDAHPLDFMFIEYAGAAQVLTAQQAKDIAYTQAEITAMIQRAIDDDTVADLPVSVVTTLLVAPAMHLARTKALRLEKLSKAQVDLTFERVWLSIAAPAQPS